MESHDYILETVEEIELESNIDFTFNEEDGINYEAFGSFEVDPDPDEDIYIPGTDEKIG